MIDDRKLARWHESLRARAAARSRQRDGRAPDARKGLVEVTCVRCGRKSQALHGEATGGVCPHCGAPDGQA